MPSRFKQVLFEYNKAPVVTRDRLYLETMQQVYSNVTKIYVDTKAGSNLLYLPLERLIAGGNAASGVGTGSAPVPGGMLGRQRAADPSDALRPRELSRNRDRDSSR